LKRKKIRAATDLTVFDVGLAHANAEINKNGVDFAAKSTGIFSSSFHKKATVKGKI
jgi:hypothetical protein